MKYTRQLVHTPDGGQVSLDFNQTNSQTKNDKIVFIIHGMVGGSESTYIKHMVQTCQINGLNSVVFQTRGTNQTKLLNPRLNHPSNLEDYRAGIEEVRKLYPDQEILVVGFSMGANFVLRILGEAWAKREIKAAVAISPPFDINHAVDTIDETVYENHFLEMFKKIINGNLDT